MFAETAFNLQKLAHPYFLEKKIKVVVYLNYGIHVRNNTSFTMMYQFIGTQTSIVYCNMTY